MSTYESGNRWYWPRATLEMSFQLWFRLLESATGPAGLSRKISPARDSRSTLRNWRFCQVQSHQTQKLGQISKIRPEQIYILCSSLGISGQLRAPIVNGGGDCLKMERFPIENGEISNFQGLVTLILHRVIGLLHTVVHHTSTSTYTPNFIESEETFCGRTDVHTDGRTNI